MSQRDESISATFVREAGRLRSFIRRRVPAPADAEDILQEVFFELVEAVDPVEQVGAWLFRVARNRIIDLFRKRRGEGEPNMLGDERADGPDLDDLLPSTTDGPESAYARRILLDELEDALEELPAEQREVFIAHEIEGQSFKQIADATGVGVNTLLSRKRYAVLHLRERLRAIHDEYLNP
ncbi:MAG: sigma-70 family RNA polymerase sigma factor [Betaproteobacteria bacterium]|nr:MAG: sigma-70 family RNA polymerase sigma factor [Betaproteobacteria bacterium]